jgi:formylglycine-generating enzyme required for sulfatase activity
MPWKNSWFQLAVLVAVISGALLIADFGPYLPEYRLPLTASNGMEMVWVDPMKGWVGKFLVTQDEYEKVAGTNPSNIKGPRYPVDTVTYEEAEAYCEKLTDKDRASGILSAQMKYSLPTNAQYDIFVGDASLDDAVTSLKGRRDEAVVGSKAPNDFGLYDTRGELWEWCEGELSEWFSPTLRGGSFIDSNPAVFILSYRNLGDPNRRIANYGFRCVVAGPSPRRW